MCCCRSLQSLSAHTCFRESTKKDKRLKTITIKVTASYQMILRQSYLIQNTRLVKMQLKLYISKLTFIQLHEYIILCFSICNEHIIFTFQCECMATSNGLQLIKALSELAGFFVSKDFLPQKLLPAIQLYQLCFYIRTREKNYYFNLLQDNNVKIPLGNLFSNRQESLFSIFACKWHRNTPENLKIKLIQKFHFCMSEEA